MQVGGQYSLESQCSVSLCSLSFVNTDKCSFSFSSYLLYTSISNGDPLSFTLLLTTYTLNSLQLLFLESMTSRRKLTVAGIDGTRKTPCNGRASKFDSHAACSCHAICFWLSSFKKEGLSYLDPSG